MLIHPEQLKLTTATGAASGNTQKLMGVVLGIHVKPATETTAYTITITNPSGIVVVERTGETGTLSEISSLPVNGIYTIAITGATRDELFLVELGVHEE